MGEFWFWCSGKKYISQTCSANCSSRSDDGVAGTEKLPASELVAVVSPLMVGGYEAMLGVIN